MESILDDIKKLLGIPKENDHFDKDIVIFINAAFAALFQLGVGSKEHAYKIEGVENTWDEFIGTSTNIENVKTYVFMSVKLAFDPPSTGPAMNSLKELLKETEWRLNVECDKEPYIIGRDA